MSWLSSIKNLQNQITGLATVATTGSYSDLNGKPAAYTLPIASNVVLGGVKVDGTSITINNGVISSAGGGGGGTSGMPYDVYGSVFGVPTASQVDVRFVTGRSFTIAANLAGSISKAGTAATSQATFLIQKNGINVASFSFAAASNTATMSSQEAITYAVGDVFKIVAPAIPDATLADIDVFINATLV